jgi:hypothetical protein
LFLMKVLLLKIDLPENTAMWIAPPLKELITISFSSFSSSSFLLNPAIFSTNVLFLIII